MRAAHPYAGVEGMDDLCALLGDRHDDGTAWSDLVRRVFTDGICLTNNRDKTDGHVVPGRPSDILGTSRPKVRRFSAT